MTEQTHNGVTGEQMIDEIQAMCLIEYAREILPRIRELNDKKQKLKDYKSELDVSVLQQAVEDAQNSLAEFYAKDDTVTSALQEIQGLQKELTQALKAASKGVGKKYKPKELKAFLSARATDKVVPIVAKGEMFSVLNETLQQASL